MPVSLEKFTSKDIIIRKIKSLWRCKMGKKIFKFVGWVIPFFLLGVGIEAKVRVWDPGKDRNFTTPDPLSRGWIEVTITEYDFRENAPVVLENEFLRIVGGPSHAFVYHREGEHWIICDINWVRGWSSHYWYSPKRFQLVRLDPEEAEGYWKPVQGKDKSLYWMGLKEGKSLAYLPKPYVYSGALPYPVRFAVGEKVVDGLLLGPGSTFGRESRREYRLAQGEKNHLFLFDPEKEEYFLAWFSQSTSSSGVKVGEKVTGLSGQPGTHFLYGKFDFPTSLLFTEAEEILVKGKVEKRKREKEHKLLLYEKGKVSFTYHKNVVPETEEVYLGGKKLEREVDYVIDYNAGRLSFTLPQKGEENLRVHYTYWDGTPQGEVVVFSPPEEGREYEVLEKVLPLDFPSGEYRIFVRCASEDERGEFTIETGKERKTFPPASPGEMEILEAGKFGLGPGEKLKVKVKGSSRFSFDYLLLVPLSKGERFPLQEISEWVEVKGKKVLDNFERDSLNREGIFSPHWEGINAQLTLTPTPALGNSSLKVSFEVEEEGIFITLYQALFSLRFPNLQDWSNVSWLSFSLYPEKVLKGEAPFLRVKIKEEGGEEILLKEIKGEELKERMWNEVKISLNREVLRKKLIAGIIFETESSWYEEGKISFYLDEIWLR